MSELWIALVAGAAAFAHCLGMCGGFALHLSLGHSRWTVLRRQLSWQGGKAATYMFLGALAGALGLQIRTQWHLPWAQNALTYLCGGIMVLMGLSLLGLLPVLRKRSPGAPGAGLVSGLFSQFLSQSNGKAPFVLGLAGGFLPCPIVWAFLVYAAQSGSVLSGMLVMAALGVGSSWSLLVLGLTGNMIQAPLRRWGTIAGGVLLVALGGVTTLRGTETFHHLLGCPQTTLSQKASGQGTQPEGSCCHAIQPATPSSQSPPACCHADASAATQPYLEAGGK
jgi:hypothetical protein